MSSHGNTSGNFFILHSHSKYSIAVQDLSTQANGYRRLPTKLKEQEKKNENLFVIGHGTAVPGEDMFACIYGKRMDPSQGLPAPQPEQVQEPCLKNRFF